MKHNPKKEYFCALVDYKKYDIDQQCIPEHIAVIMDGNGRWARQKGAARIFGHKNALEAVRNVTEGCGELGVKYLTLYAFSTENWGRPKDEVNALMNLLLEAIESELQALMKNQVMLRLIGDAKTLPKSCRNKLEKAVEDTKNNKGLQVLLALSYSGRWEILHAVKQLVTDVTSAKLNSSEINEQVFKRRLQTHDVPDPELLIRTGGDERISNFLLWQLAYTELYFSRIFWPDFRKEHLFEAIRSYQQRERRFGKIPHQAIDK